MDTEVDINIREKSVFRAAIRESPKKKHGKSILSKLTNQETTPKRNHAIIEHRAQRNSKDYEENASKNEATN